MGESGTGRDATLGGGNYALGNLTLSRRALLHFTTNPEKLYRRLYAAGHSPSDEVFVQIADTLFGVFKQADRCFVLMLEDGGRDVFFTATSRATLRPL